MHEARQRASRVGIPMLNMAGENLPDLVDHQEVPALLCDTTLTLIGTAAKGFQFAPNTCAISTYNNGFSFVASGNFGKGLKAATVFGQQRIKALPIIEKH